MFLTWLHTLNDNHIFMQHILTYFNATYFTNVQELNSNYSGVGDVEIYQSVPDKENIEGGRRNVTYVYNLQPSDDQ